MMAGPNGDTPGATTAESTAAAARLFAGSGEMRALGRARDWARTPLGPVAAWSPTLRVAVRLCLDAGFPTCLYAGDELVLIYNDGFIASLGRKHPDALGRPAREVWAEIWAQSAPDFEQVRATGAPVFHYDQRFVFDRGADVPQEAFFTFAFSPVHDDAGELVGVLSTISETTARVRAEAALAAERETLRALILAMPAPLALLDGPEHRYVLVNEAFRRAITSGRDVTGLTPQEAFPELAGTGMYERNDRVYATGEPWIGPETPVRYDRDGTGLQDTWFDLRFEPVRDADGRVTAILHFAVEVTEQVQARRSVEALLAAERAARGRMERLLAASFALTAAATPAAVAAVIAREGAALVEADAGAVYLRTSADGESGGDEASGGADGLRLLSETGFEASAREEFAWVPLEAAVPVAEAARTGELVLLEGHAALAARYPALAASIARAGRAALLAAPLRVGERVIGALAFAYDAPRAFTAEERGFAAVLAQQCAQALDRAGLLAAERAARAAAETERAAAEEARRAAEAANRAKGEFLAVMSHELRTPLNAIGGYSELIELGIHGPVTDAQRTALGRIQASQRHLLGLIAAVLDYSRVEAGAVTYRLSDVPVVEAVAEAEALVAPQLRSKGLGYAWSGAPAALSVRADREKLQQVLLNLLGNAVKFTDARDGAPGRVEVTCAVEDGADGTLGCVLLRVCDTGVGIAPEKLASVFEPFVQADQRLTRPQEGVGLGLAISRDLARGMGGDLTAESTPGAGSTFTLTLPRGSRRARSARRWTP